MKVNITSCFLLVIIVLSGTDVLSSSELNTRIVFELHPSESHQPTLRWIENSKWCWGIEVPYYYEQDYLSELYKNFDKVIVKLDANPDAALSEAEFKGRKLYEIEDVFANHRRAQVGTLDKTIWLGLLENDSAGTRFPQKLLTEKPKTHSKAKELFDEHVKDAVAASEDFDSNIPFWGVCGYAQSAHIFAEHGVDCVIVERANDDVADLQTAVAFARGASNQYKNTWGIDISLWWGPIYGCVQNLDSSFHRRNLYISYFSGAESFRIEGGHLFFDPEKQQFNKIKDTVNEFGEFILKVPPGKPVVPVAVIMPSDHGWMSRPYWQTTTTAWNYAKIPYRQGQKGIDGFFGMAFPGNVWAMQAFPFGSYVIDDPPASPFALSCITEEFAPGKDDIFYAEPPLPFGLFESRDQARKVFNKGAKLQADARAMSDSRWGDIFDVLTDKVHEDALEKYKLAVLLGQVKLTDKLESLLKDYVQNGGKLILAAGVARPDSYGLTGVNFSPELLAARAVKWGEQPFKNDAFLFVPVTKMHENVNVLARTDTGHPAVTSFKMGKGKVYTVLAPWYQAAHSDLSSVASDLFDKVIISLQPAQIKGLPVEWIVTEGENFRTVLLANHRSKKWDGAVSLTKGKSEVVRCVELLSGKDFDLKDALLDQWLNIEIEPYGLKIIRWYFE